jgi:uncharacterized phiE125 gp8 family phage protein
MPNYRLVTAPATEPLTLTEAKLHLRVDDSIEDDMITSWIKSARMYVEGETMSPMISQTWAMQFDKSELNLLVWNVNKAPLISFSSVTYYDSNNDLQTLATTAYETDIYGSPARFRLKSVPVVYDRMNALQLNFVCGYANAAAVPQPLISAVKLMLGHLYENRQQVVTGTQVNRLEDAISSLIAPYRNNFIYAPMNG